MDFDSDHVDANLAIRLLMPGKEVGVIIGMKGETIKRFRQLTGAKINISDNSSPERVVSIIGTAKSIHDTFTLLVERMSEAIDSQSRKSRVTAPPLTFRLIVPASQCGSLIGKGGSNIKRIRDESGANIQVASEMLPNSTERAVTISGYDDSVTQCVYQVCKVLLETPTKGTTIPYRPMSAHAPMYGGAPAGGNPPMSNNFMHGNFGGMMPPENFDHPMPLPPKMNPMGGMMGGMGSMGGGFPGGGAGAPFASASNVVSALAALAGSQLRSPAGDKYSGEGHAEREKTISQDVSVPNDVIGCVIGKGGTKIAEIRQMTGAMITISKFDDKHEDGQRQERVVTIKGTNDQVALAQYLINTSVELHKANSGEEADDNGHQSMGEDGSGYSPSAIPLANLLKNPAALNALSTLTNMNVGSLNGLQELLSRVVGSPGAGGQGSRKSYTPRMRHMPGGTSPPQDGKRYKFQPY